MRSDFLHGSHVVGTLAATTCLACYGTGYAEVPGCRGVMQRCTDCTAFIDNHTSIWLERSGLPRRYREADPFIGFAPRSKDHHELIKAMMAYAEAFSPGCGGVLLAGNPGVGKSRLAAAIARRIITRGFTCVWWNQVRLMARIADTFDDPNDAEYLIISPCVEADLLVLDDFGAGGNAEWILRRIEDILNQRLDRQATTIVTTNISLADKTDIGERLYSRAFEIAPNHIHRIAIHGGDGFESDFRRHRARDGRRHAEKGRK